MAVTKTVKPRLHSRFGTLYRLFWMRKLPYGVRCRRTHHPDEISAHRALAAHVNARIPRFLSRILNLWMQLRWSLLFSTWYSYRTVRVLGAGVRTRHGIGLPHQFFQLWKLSALNLIPPWNVYQYRLFLPDRKPLLCQYVYDSELPAYHQWRSGFPSASNPSLRLIQNKKRLTDKLIQAGLPGPITLAVLSRGSSAVSVENLQARGKSLFCKPIHGSRGEGAIRLDAMENGFSIQTLGENRQLTGQQARDYLQTLLDNEEYIVQPYYPNHPALAALSEVADTAVTLRIITRKAGQEFIPFCAYLEIPWRVDADQADGKIGFMPLPIKLASGALQPGPDLPRAAPAQAAYDRIVRKIPGVVVPGWDSIYRTASTAHALVPELYALAWDFIVTPEGCVLLEGNFNWRVAPVQMFTGGLLAESAPASDEV